jgi:apolipoprotein N-acyltransferase
VSRSFALAAGVLAGLALAGAHPPIGVGLLALAVPLLVVAGVDASAHVRTPAWHVGALASAVGHGLVIVWLIEPAGFIGWGLLVLVQVAWWSVLAATVRWMPTGIARPLLVGLVWVGVDTLRGWVPFNGFAWGTLGAATVDIPWFASLARIAGEKAMTLAVVVLGVAAYELLRAPVLTAIQRDGRVTWTGLRDGLPAGQAGTAWLAGTALVVTMATVEPPPATGSAEVLLVQPSDIRTWDGTGAERVATIARSAASLTAASIKADGLPDLVVWPESSIDADPSRFEPLAQALRDGGAVTQGRLLTGTNLDGPRPRTFLNTIQVVGADGAFVDDYVKRRLVPFGEYIPFRRWLEWFPPLDQVPRDGVASPDPDVLVVNDIRVAPVICFETMYGWLVRSNVLAATEPAELIVTVTNNASFGEGGQSLQHIAQTQLRALETGRWVAHAAISGASAFIDPDGGVHDTTALFRTDTLRRQVDLVEGRTPFLATGDWLAPLTGVAAIVLAALGLLAWRRDDAPLPDGHGDTSTKDVT